MEDLQELLGDHHDSVVTRDLLRSRPASPRTPPGRTRFTYGLLHARQAEAAHGLETGLPAARKALAAKQIRRWLG